MRPQAIAVIGACAPERRHYARRLSDRGYAPLIPAQQIEQDASVVQKTLQDAARWKDYDSVVLEYPLQTPALHIIGELADATTFDHQYGALPAWYVWIYTSDAEVIDAITPSLFLFWANAGLRRVKAADSPK